MIGVNDLLAVKIVTLNQCGVVWNSSNKAACGKKENPVDLLGG